MPRHSDSRGGPSDQPPPANSWRLGVWVVMPRNASSMPPSGRIASAGSARSRATRAAKRRRRPGRAAARQSAPARRNRRQDGVLIHGQGHVRRPEQEDAAVPPRDPRDEFAVGEGSAAAAAWLPPTRCRALVIEPQSLDPPRGDALMATSRGVLPPPAPTVRLSRSARARYARRWVRKHRRPPSRGPRPSRRAGGDHRLAADPGQQRSAAPNPDWA